MKRATLLCLCLPAILSRILAASPLEADSSEKVGGAINVVREFYRWYCMNYHETNPPSFLLDGGVQGKQYAVDFQKVDQFTYQLMSSGFFSETFPGKVNAFFTRCNQKLFTMNQTEGPPIDLNRDLIFCSQEFDLTPEFADFFTFSNVHLKDGIVMLTIHTPYEWSITSTLLWTDSRWKIDALCDIK